MPIPICFCFNYTEGLYSDYKTTCLTNHLILSYVVLYFKGFRDVLYNIISQCCVIWCIDSTVLKCLYKLCHIGTYVTKHNIMYLIKLLTVCCFIGKVNYVSVVEGSQHMPLCVVNNSLVVRLLGVVYNIGPGLVHHILVHDTHTQGLPLIE